MLQIKDLHAGVGGKEILRGINLTINEGEVHAVMGPNGSGKSTLARVLAGDPGYEVISGEVLYDGKDLIALQPEERARAGIFLAFQYPVEIAGVANAYFLRAAYNAMREARGEEEVDPMDFLDIVEEKLKIVDMDPAMLRRSVNAGFSGGEKKRNEILQMAVLEPRLAILDETDSGLDIDALRTVAEGVNKLRSPKRSTIVVTHYQRLLNYIVPDFVHVLVDGRIARSGEKELAHELEARGYDWIIEAETKGAGSIRVTDHFVAQYDKFSRNGGANAPEWIRPLRRHAIDRFSQLGFPTQKNEDWHFTSVQPIADAPLTAVQPAEPAVTAFEIANLELGRIAWPTFVFVNGNFSALLSSVDALPEGVEAMTLTSLLAGDSAIAKQYLGKIAGFDEHTFTALNTAFLHEGAFIRVRAGTEPATPLRILYLSDRNAVGTVTHPRTLIVAEPNARLSVIESYVGMHDGQYFTNAVTEISLGEGATVHHYKLQRESRAAFHVGTVEALQAKDSHFVSFSLATGARLSRTNIYTKLDGEGCGATLNGLYMADGDQHVDHQTRIEHAQPNCYSREIYKGILDGSSHGVFNGKVYVHPIAQKTDGKQSNDNLLLSEKAHADTKPQLEIFADDVKCTHGATVGRIDEVALFYMKSRGLGADTARDLLTYAFAAEVLEQIDLDELKLELESLTMSRFKGRSGGTREEGAKKS